jgi:hypothetical protein
MLNRRTLTARSLAQKSAELAIATPQVMAHRLTRMALAGPVLSARDQREFHRMSTEKAAAFTQAWQAMGWHALQTQSRWWKAMVPTAGTLKPTGWLTASMAAARMQHDALTMMNQGLQPVHRKAVANAKRLRRTPLK